MNMPKESYEEIVSKISSEVYGRLESKSEYYELSYDKEEDDEDEEEMLDLVLSAIDEVIADLKIDVIRRWCPLQC